jgi:hypothetical protein
MVGFYWVFRPRGFAALRVAARPRNSKSVRSLLTVPVAVGLEALKKPSRLFPSLAASRTYCLVFGVAEATEGTLLDGAFGSTPCIAASSIAIATSKSA